MSSKRNYRLQGHRPVAGGMPIESAGDRIPYDESRRRKGVKVTAAALGAATALALAGGLLADGTAAAATGAVGRSSSTKSGPPIGSTRSPSSSLPPGSPPAGGPPVAVGTVSSASSDSFLVSTTDGKTVKVDVTSSTVYRDRGTSEATMADVSKGEHVCVIGSSSNDTVTATTVLIGQPPAGPPPGTKGTAPAGPPPIASGGGDPSGQRAA